MLTTTAPVMPEGARVEDALSPHSHDFYHRMLAVALDSGVEFLVGGTYALEHYAGITRPSKDLDLFVRARDAQRMLDLFRGHGCRVELTFPHWLGKAFYGEDFIDVIFNAGNGVAAVDDDWFTNASTCQVFGHELALCPAEETIWSKAWVMERERYDGADIAHILRARAQGLDWKRLIDRFGEHWRVLLSHLVMFGFVYPGERHKVPEWVMQTLLERVSIESSDVASIERVCQGTLVSREQYLIDIDRWDYADARLSQTNMSEADVAHWTAAIQNSR